MSKLNELRQALGKAVDELNSPDIIADKALYEAKEAEIADIEQQIARAEKAMTRSRSLAGPARIGEAADETHGAGAPSGGAVAVASRAKKSWTDSDFLREARQEIGFSYAADTHFRSLGEQLQSVARAAIHRDEDRRLVRAGTDEMVSRAGPSGSSVMDPTSGGFLVQTDFSTAVFARAYSMGEILSRVQKMTISSNANGIKIPGVDETSRANGSRWGGVQSYWLGEGQSATPTKPKFRLIELDLKKMMSTMYMTDELLSDQSILTALANQAFSEEITFMVEAAILDGTGAGMPLGIFTSPAKVSVAKETGQDAKTVKYENVKKMWSRCWARSRKDAIWAINQDVEPELFGMAQVIGTAGVPVYLPANGISGQPYGSLFGRPVVPIEYAETLGTEGDISLIDPSQYVLVDKGGVQAASSMHVAFLTDEMVFRITYRVDGEPIWHAPLTPAKGTNTLSPFVTLATRA